MKFAVVCLALALFMFDDINAHEESTKNETGQKFQIEYQWTFINFTWKNEKMYNDAIAAKKYIPENVAPAGIKIHNNRLYIAIPRMCTGVPVTLGYIQTGKTTPKTNSLITPFPDWETNDLTNHTCKKLESVQSMEIDKDGIMWVIDGLRSSPDAKCPAKLVLYDLKKSNVIHSFDFPEEICLSKGGFLNDIVIDDKDGGFAYISDQSFIDPGLIVYSRAQNRAWKLRDSSMFAKPSPSFTVNGDLVSILAPIDGIALSPVNPTGSKYVYYSSIDLNLYEISTDILKNESVIVEGQWRKNVTFVGAKPAQSDGMTIDNAGTLYYGLLSLNGVGRWKTNSSFATNEIMVQNRSTIVWPDSFAFDNFGYLYLLADNIQRFYLTKCDFNTTKQGVLFRIFKYFTNTQSYLY